MGQILSMLSPFLLGSAMAFILNVPMRAIERGIFRGAAGKVRRPLSLLLTLIAVIGVLVLASCVIGPGIGEAASSITAQIPYAIQRLQNQLEELSGLSCPSCRSIWGPWTSTGPASPSERWKSPRPGAAAL